MCYKLIKNKIIKKIIYLLPTRNVIVFESVPDFSDNTRPVFEELIKRKFNNKYLMVWSCSKKPSESYPKIKNVRYIDANRNKLSNLYYKHFSKVTISCNRFVYADRKDQTSFYLMHGSPIKNTTGFYVCPNEISFMITPSKYMNDKCASAMKYDVNRSIPLGYPRNDEFYKEKLDLSLYFGKYKKYIIWYPTVKQYIGGPNLGIKPISFLDTMENANTINDLAKMNDVLIIIKPHFAQMTDNLNNSELSNIKFIDDSFYQNNGISSYNFIGSFDALLTDYSSVFYDFLLVDKPIGFIWEDIEQFKKEVGLYDFYQTTTKCGEKIYNLSDLLHFITMVSMDKDKLKEERNEICRLANFSNDGKNAARVTDFIVEKAGLKL